MATAESRNHALDRDESHVRYGARLPIISCLRKNRGQDAYAYKVGRLLPRLGSEELENVRLLLRLAHFLPTYIPNPKYANKLLMIVRKGVISFAYFLNAELLIYRENNRP